MRLPDLLCRNVDVGDRAAHESRADTPRGTHEDPVDQDCLDVLGAEVVSESATTKALSLRSPNLPRSLDALRATGGVQDGATHRAIMTCRMVKIAMATI
jgi:hypothetical protein